MTAMTINYRLFVLIAILECNGAPTEEQCVNAHLHNIRIFAQSPDLSGEMRQQVLKSVVNRDIAPAMIESCMKKKTRSQIRCEMKSETLDELSRCKD